MRRRLIVTACLVLALLIVGVTYKKWAPRLHETSNNRGAISSQPSVSSVPPFATKEPERYQATRTIIFTESVANAAAPVKETLTTRVFIVRDGDQRREEYEGGDLGSIVYLEVPSGRFVLLSQAKVYADLSAGGTGLSELNSETESVSPDLLLNESAVSSSYDKLGAETIGGRATTKYRVTTTTETNATITSETFIWIDETLGMPIKSESTHNNSDRSTRLLMELTDIRSDVEAKAFGLPADYQKVAASLIRGMIRKSAIETRTVRASSPDQK